MYSPKIPERLIPPLYRLARAQGRFMTRVVAEVLEAYLVDQGALDEPTPLRRPAPRARRARRAA